MTPLQIVECLGIEWERTKPGMDIDAPPGGGAAATLNGDRIYINVKEGFDVDAIHEALHLVIGHRSFKDETALMALEYAVAQELDATYYAIWRDDFDCYGLACGEVGDFHGDAFLYCCDWMLCHSRAVEQDLLLPDGRPIWGAGVHPELRKHLRPSAVGLMVV